MEKGLSNQEAYDKTLENCKDFLGNEDDEPLFWFALAETQWKVGKLIPEVKTKALDWLEKGGELALWNESKNSGKGWQKTLDKLRKKLETPQQNESVFEKKYSLIKTLGA